jgi:hypothetical protein
MVDILLFILKFIFNVLFKGIPFIISLLLNMQINFNNIFDFIHSLYMINKYVINQYILYNCFGNTRSENLNTHLIIEFEYTDESFFYKKKINSNSDTIFDQYDFTILFNYFIEFIYIYKWFLLPLILYIIIIYLLHTLLGLYSVYVDYFQKNPSHIDSYRAAIPAVFIFYLLLFIFTSLIFFFFNLYLIYLIWFVLI